MWRNVSLPKWLAALVVALLPCLAHAGSDSEPKSCKGITEASTCAQQESCINARFKAVLEKNPDKACENSASAGWDATVARKLQQSEDAECKKDTSVCKGTYNRLKTAVSDYKSLMMQACESKKSAKSCANKSTLDQSEALGCLKQVKDTNAALNEKARGALQAAMDASKIYKQLIDEVKLDYGADMTKINQAEKVMESTGADPSTIAEEKSRASAISGAKFISGNGSLLQQLDGSREVDARNGGASTITQYQEKHGLLVNDLATADSTIDEFQKAAAAEISKRNASAANFVSLAKRDTQDVKTDNGAGASITGASGDKNNSSGSDNGALLKNVTNLSNLASAGAGLAGAMGAANNTGASAGAPAGLGSGLEGTAPTPGSSTLNDSPGGSGQSGVAPPGGSNVGGAVPGRTAQRDHQGTLDGISGGGGGARSSSETGSLVSAGGAGTAGSFTAHANAGDDMSIKESGRDPASANPAKACSGADCAAIGDVKSEQFNSGGSLLGVPKIGAADPAFSTKGALENLFGPLPSLDSLIPTDSLSGGAAPALEGMLAKMGGAVTESFSPVDAQSSGVAPANTRSLFERVHSVHEVALKRGSVALFHKRL